MCSAEKCHLDSSENWGVTVFPQAGHMQRRLQPQRHLLAKLKISLQGHKEYFFLWECVSILQQDLFTWT